MSTMMDNELLVQEKELENTALVARQILTERSYNDHDKHELMLQFLTAAKIKPVSSIGINNKSKDLHTNVAKKLGLTYHIEPPNNAGYSEMVISSDPRLLDEFKAVNNNSDQQKRIGELLGYSQPAIQEFLSQTGNRPAKFWQDVLEGKKIPDELLIVWQVAGMIPASSDDSESRKLGSQIIDFLNKIDPAIMNEYLQKGQTVIGSEAREAIEHWRVS